MFEKMTPRERILASAVGALLPIAILFIGIFWFIGKYNANDVQESAMISQVADEEMRALTAQKASRRRTYYDNISLPADINNASNDYQSWMKALVSDDLKMNLKSFNPRDGGDLKLGAKVIGKRKTYSLTAIGNLKQLRGFLERFYSVEALHRINTMKITAQNETKGGSADKKVRSGQLSIMAQIEVLALDSSQSNSEFIQRFRSENVLESELAKSNLAFGEMVEHRDVFGPPNNTPTIDARTSTSYTSLTDVKVGLVCKDADEDDLLTYEILESDIEGVELETAQPGDRTGKMLIPGQKAGRYKLTLKITDNGFPPKESTEDVTVSFKDRVVVTKPEPPKPEPAYVNAKQTLITGIVRDRAGDWQVWISVRTTPDRYRLKVGESFELDQKTWMIKEIGPDQAVIEVDNKLLTFKPADRFDSPRNVVELAPVETAEAVPEAKVKLEKSKLESDSKTAT